MTKTFAKIIGEWINTDVSCPN